MTIKSRETSLSQSLDVRGSETIREDLDLLDEAEGLGSPVLGQSGSSASFASLAAGEVTVTGLTGMLDASSGRFLSISGAATSGNNGTFLITEFISASSVKIDHSSATVPDASNGSLVWLERNPYSLEDDLNYRRSDSSNIKNAIGINDNDTSLAGKLTNLTNYYPFSELPDGTPSVVEALNTLNREIGNRVYDGYLVSGETITESLNRLENAVSAGGGSGSLSGLTAEQHASLRQLIHLASTSSGGVFEGFEEAYLEYTPNSFMPTKVTWWTSPDKIGKIVEKDITYTAFARPDTIRWRCYNTDNSTVLADVTDTITYQDVFEISRTRSITDFSVNIGTLTGQSHKILRQLIHLAPNSAGGPMEGFTSNAYLEITGGAFPTSYIWYTSAAKTNTIVEKNITYNGSMLITEIEYKAYDTDNTLLATVTDTISYESGTPFEASRIRTIS